MVTTAHRRRDRRLAVSRAYDAHVEFERPHPNGNRWRLTLLDMSVAGLSFVLADELRGLEIGTSLKKAVVRLEEHEMRGDLVVMRITPEDSRTVCGALFYPCDEEDLEKLKAALAWIESRRVPE